VVCFSMGAKGLFPFQNPQTGLGPSPISRYMKTDGSPYGLKRPERETE